MDSITHSRQEQNIINDETDLISLFLFFWSRKLILTIATSAGVILSILYSLSIPNKYISETILSPSSSFQTNSNTGMMRYSGVASLAGISLPSLGGSNNRVNLAIEILNSRDFRLRFVEKRDIAATLVASKNWDKATRSIIYDEEIYDFENSRWIATGANFNESGPTSQTIIDSMTDLISIKKDIETGFVKISIKHYSPDIAQQWLIWIVEDINLTIKKRDLEFATKTKKYLVEQIEKNSIAQLNQVFNNLVEQQVEKIMLAEVQEEYAFTIIDPPILPERKSEPSRVKVVLFCSVISLLISMIFVSVFALYSNRNKE